MSFSSVVSAAVIGLRAEIIHVEADISNGLPVFHMVGYLSSEVKEAGERVRTAIRNSRIDFPAKKVVINLSPANVRKRGASFDLPIAAAVLSALGQADVSRLQGMLVVGELGLDGKVLEVPGILPIVMKAKEEGFTGCSVPIANAADGELGKGIEVYGVKDLGEVSAFLRGETALTREPYPKKKAKGRKKPCGKVDFADIQGQEAVKRAVEVAVAGGHNILLIGPPGSGKSMAAQRIPTILPPMTLEESMEITKIYSILGMVDSEFPLIRERPFRSVHHTATKAALIGGGLVPSPGEISLSHGGVLFLDELPEFRKHVLEMLRQPLEEHEIQIARVQGNYVFPADFILAASMNPCECGMYPQETCTCTPGQIQNYMGRISQPFLDRIDICVEAPRVEYSALQGRTKAESSESIRARVCRARELQTERYQSEDVSVNARLGTQEIKKYCGLGAAQEKLMEQAFSALNLTARTYHKVLKVARTIADLDECREIEEKHLREAISYRMLDKKYWGR